MDAKRADYTNWSEQYKQKPSIAFNIVNLARITVSITDGILHKKTLFQ